MKPTFLGHGGKRAAGSRDPASWGYRPAVYGWGTAACSSARVGHRYADLLGLGAPPGPLGLGDGSGADIPLADRRHIYQRALAGAAVVAVLATGLAVSPAGAGTTDPGGSAIAARQGCKAVTVIGHRGIGGPHENTVKGWNLAARGGTDVVEGDVWLTEDRVPVIVHDPTWDRTTNWTGRVDQTPYSVVRKRIRTDGGDRIPTLNRALRWSAANDVGLMMDVKWAPSWESVARKVDRLGVDDQVTFYTRPHHATGGLGAIDRARTAGLLTGVKAWYGRWPMTPEEIGMHGDYVVVGHERADNPPYVERMHAAGVQVYPKGSTRTSWPALLRAGVDGLTVANPGRYRRWCNSRTP